MGNVLTAEVRGRWPKASRRVTFWCVSFFGGVILGVLSLMSPLQPLVLDASIRFIRTVGPGGWFSWLAAFSPDLYAAFVYAFLPVFLASVGIGAPHGVLLWLFIRYRAGQTALLIGFVLPTAGFLAAQLFSAAVAWRHLPEAAVWTRFFFPMLGRYGGVCAVACICAIALSRWSWREPANSRHRRVS